MRTLHVLLLSSLIVSIAITTGCAHKFGTDPYDGDQIALYREAAELRAAAQYYEEEARRSEASRELERAQRYRDFAQLARVQAAEIDQRAAEFGGS
ncbi:MAG TPA: hypothetical protein VIU63_07480 [Nitrospira sp.]